MTGRRGGRALRGAGRSARSAALAAVTTALAAPLLARTPPAARPGWTRGNYRGADVTLAGGAAAALGTLVATLADGDVRAAGLTAAATLAGGWDDLAAPATEVEGDKGIAGHLAAARAGRVSGGVVKVAVVGAAAWWAVGPAATAPLDRLVRAVAVAGTANLVNLLDLRPGRAGKVVLALAVPAGGARAGAVAGATAAALPGDLAETTMLGDTGAAALGAVLGLRLATGSRPLAMVTAAVATALAVVSERVSFSAVIARHGPLRALDGLGRRYPPGRPT